MYGFCRAAGRVVSGLAALVLAGLSTGFFAGEAAAQSGSAPVFSISVVSPEAITHTTEIVQFELTADRPVTSPVTLTVERSTTFLDPFNVDGAPDRVTLGVDTIVVQSGFNSRILTFDVEALRQNGAVGRAVGLNGTTRIGYRISAVSGDGVASPEDVTVRVPGPKVRSLWLQRLFVVDSVVSSFVQADLAFTASFPGDSASRSQINRVVQFDLRNGTRRATFLKDAGFFGSDTNTGGVTLSLGDIEAAGFPFDSSTTVTVTLSPPLPGAPYVLGRIRSRSIDLSGQLRSQVTIAAPASPVPSDAAAVDFTVRSTFVAPAGGLAVPVSLPGNQNGTSRTVTIPAGKRRATLTVPRSDYAPTAGDLDITATLVDADAYVVGAERSATVTIPAAAGGAEPPPPTTVDEPPTPGPDTGTLTLVKEVVGAGNGRSAFEFVISGAVTATRILSASQAQQGSRYTSPRSAAIEVPAGGTVTVEERRRPGFRYIGATCVANGTSVAIRETAAAARFDIDVPGGTAIVCTIVNRGESARTEAIVANFLRRRAEHLTADTGRSRLIERRQDARRAAGGLGETLGITGAGGDRQGRLGMYTSASRLGAALTRNAARLGVDAGRHPGGDGDGYRTGWDAWTEANWSYRRSDDSGTDAQRRSGQFGLLRAGVDYLASPHLLVGVLVQYDYLSDRARSAATGGHRISGHGWMVGPYVERELTKNLFLDARSLWGTSKNKVSPDLTFEDEFSTTRWLASARLTGAWTFATSSDRVWHFSPRAEVVWLDEQSEAFTNALGVAIGRQRVRLGRLKAGPEISYRSKLPNGTVIEPRFAAQAPWAFSRSGTDAARALDVSELGAAGVPFETFQMRFEGGLKVELPQGTRIELEGAYTGLGTQGEETIGGKIGVTIPLQ